MVAQHFVLNNMLYLIKSEFKLIASTGRKQPCLRQTRKVLTHIAVLPLPDCRSGPAASNYNWPVLCIIAVT